MNYVISNYAPLPIKINLDILLWKDNNSGEFASIAKNGNLTFAQNYEKLAYV